MYITLEMEVMTNLVAMTYRPVMAWVKTNKWELTSGP